MHNEQENYFCHKGFLDQKIICTENSTHRLPVVVSRCYLQSCNGLNQVRVVSLSETEQQCSCLVEHLLDSAYSHRSTGHGTSSVLHRCRLVLYGVVIISDVCINYWFMITTNGLFSWVNFGQISQLLFLIFYVSTVRYIHLQSKK